MKTNLHPAQLTRLPLLAALLCSSPLVALARESAQRNQRVESFPQQSTQEQTTRLENRSQLAHERHTVSKEYLHQRVEWLKIKDPRHFKTHAYFDTLIEQGYDPLLLDAWLDGLYDGVVVVGMPGDLVLNYYGEPAFRKEVVFEGAPAFEWGIRLLPGRIEKVTVVGGKVVRVHA